MVDKVDGTVHEPVELTPSVQARVDARAKAGKAAEARARVRSRQSGVNAAVAAQNAALGIRRNNQTTDSNN